MSSIDWVCPEWWGHVCEECALRLDETFANIARLSILTYNLACRRNRADRFTWLQRNGSRWLAERFLLERGFPYGWFPVSRLENHDPIHGFTESEMSSVVLIVPLPAWAPCGHWRQEQELLPEQEERDLLLLQESQQEPESQQEQELQELPQKLELLQL